MPYPIAGLKYFTCSEMSNKGDRLDAAEDNFDLLIYVDHTQYTKVTLWHRTCREAVLQTVAGIKYCSEVLGTMVRKLLYL